MPTWKYEPKQATLGLPDGQYSASIKTVEDTHSKKGDPMRVITFEVYDGSDTTTIKDYYLEGNRIAMYRMKQLAIAVGDLQRFEEGFFDAYESMGKNLVVEIVTDYRGYNKVKAFIPASASAISEATGDDANPEPEDDLPF